jgi:hypothetical protein
MRIIAQTSCFFHYIFFDHPKTKTQSRVQLPFFILLFLTGIVHWVGFFNGGHLPLIAHDWAKEAFYMNTLREAMVSSVFPWSWDGIILHGSEKIMANPEIALTPDIILLRWVSNGVYALIHVILFYSIGFFSCLLIARNLKSSLAAFLFFWLIFNFNGYIIAHLAIGHFQWTGYFLLPLFFLVLAAFLKEAQVTSSLNTTYALSMAFLLGLLFLNGSFHIAIWCLMFMAITLLWHGSMWQNVVVASLIGILLGFGRLFPAALFASQRTAVIAGYHTFVTLVDAFTVPRSHEVHLWWEFNIYIGFVAFIFLAACFIFTLNRRKTIYQHPFLATACLFLLFSLGDVYTLITKFPFPFANIERVPSRFIIIPFILFLITAMIGIDELFRAYPRKSKVAALILLPFIAYELMLHSLLWRIDVLNQSFQHILIPVVPLALQQDLTYTFTVYASWSISITTFLVITILFVRNQHRRYKNQHDSIHEEYNL